MDPDYDDPFRCCICGAWLNGERDRILANGRSVPHKFSWRIRCSVEDFNQIVFRNREVWGTFIRSIIVTLDNSRPLYQLSGIAQFDYSNHIIVPKDRNLAVLGYPCLGGRSCKFVKIEVDELVVGYSRGHLIHARCWDLIERLFGCEAEKNLKILLDIFQERRHNQDGKMYEAACYDFLREDRKNSIVYHDPVKILPLRAVIEESAQRPYREKFGCETLKPRPIFLDIKHTAISDILPCEIQCMILDLMNYKEIPQLLRAFGWVLSNSYWYRRFPEDLVFEADDIMESNAEIDWQFLTLGVEKLLQCSFGLLNRRRLLTVLRQARDLFFKEVAKQHH
ncbi:hypothetical protein BGW36DRAFT_364129 [Talaromyces proteolyticus]|uniref:Uncharacterized protein n=1 Tax=Talaromyces proteolyticus TaxID=1131652 RepID=A0AAD4KGH3_9EURO|nr:uncharacterized protein BGW36DRAFT_364129 [Talaromyces proteolyticus]KAH8690558.1 hypothetical protein BGW36DRAFT_364129 [Talaromyces proteolyticus]